MTTALYRFLDGDQRLLYVGITGHLGRRMAQHAADKSWWAQVATITVEHFDARAAAAEAEAAAIRSEAPLYNICLTIFPNRSLDLDGLIRKTWGESLSGHMDRVGLTRRGLRERLAERGVIVSSQTVDNWVMGVWSPRPSIMVALALVLDTSADRLFPLDGIAS